MRTILAALAFALVVGVVLGVPLAWWGRAGGVAWDDTPDEL